MQHVKTGILAAVVLAFLLGLCSCNSLALTGPKKYKVDLSNILLAVKGDIENTGAVSEKNVTKLQEFLDANREEFGTKGSFIRTQEALDSILASQSAIAEGKDGFMMLQEAKQSIYSAQDMLKTEVKDD